MNEDIKILAELDGKAIFYKEVVEDYEHTNLFYEMLAVNGLNYHSSYNIIISLIQKLLKNKTISWRAWLDAFEYHGSNIENALENTPEQLCDIVLTAVKNTKK